MSHFKSTYFFNGRKSCNSNKLLGKTYFDINEITDSLIAAGGLGIECCENHDYDVSIFANKNDTNIRYIFLEKKVKGNSENNKYKILDIVNVNISNYTIGSNIQHGYCKILQGKYNCDPFAVYYHNSDMAQKEQWITPEKGWIPNITKEKLVEISKEDLQCSSPKQEDYENNAE